MRMISNLTRLIPLFGLGMLIAACQPTPTPDYTIQVKPTPQGMVAIPPTCPNFTTATASRFDNQPIPQFGCANARNLAFMVERPDDLIQGRDMGASSGVIAVGAMRRYNNNQTRGLLDVGTSPDSSIAVTTATTATSGMSGDATSSGSSSSSAAPAAAAPGP